jgi:hypothetical protein
MDWKLREKLMARPVVTGQVLVNVANPAGEWELELLMPEKRMKYLDDAIKKSGEPLPVDFILATNPSDNHTAILKPDAIHQRAELDPTDGPVVKLKVKLDSMDRISRRPGAVVIADVTCGRANAAFVWFHEVFEWVQANVLF